MKKINNKTDVLRFIDLYRSHEVLWNVNISSYRRNDLKLKAYESIAADMKMTVEAVKKKIKSLRTAYSAEKSKVEKSKKSECGTYSVYVPTVFWYNEMSFLDPALMRRTTVDNSNQQDYISLVETSVDSEASEVSYSLSSCTCSRKRKRSSEFTTKLNNALDEIITINKSAGVFEKFGENVGRQIMEFPEDEAYQLMADIQVLLSKRKRELLRKERERNSTPSISKKESYNGSDN